MCINFEHMYSRKHTPKAGDHGGAEYAQERMEVSHEEDNSFGDGAGGDGKVEVKLEVVGVTGPGEEEAATPRKRRNAWFQEVEKKVSRKEEGGSGHGTGEGGAEAKDQPRTPSHDSSVKTHTVAGLDSHI